MYVILLILIFIRPFISSLAFPALNYLYSIMILTTLIFWFIFNGPSFIVLRKFSLQLSIFLIALIISIAFSIYKFNSFVELYKYIGGLSLFIIALSLGSQDKKRVINTIILSAFIISLLAIYQYLFGFQNLLKYMSSHKIMEPFSLDYISRKRVFFPFVTPNILGGYIAMVIPLCLWNKNRFWIIVPLGITILLTKSISAILSLFLGLTIYFYLSGKIRKKEIAILLGILITGGVIFILRSVLEKEHTQPIFSAVARFDYWKATLSIIKKHPLFGVGIGNFNLPQCRYAHNSYLQIWAEMGILGIISFFWLIISIIKSSLNNLSYKKEIIALIAANSIFLINNLLDFSFFLPEVSFIWWVILGL